MRHYGAFLGEPFYVGGFLTEEGFRDEDGEIGVLVAGFLEHVVQLPLHPFPDAEAIGFDDHTAPYGGVLGQVGVLDDIEVPLGVIFVSGGNGTGHIMNYCLCINVL